MNLPTLTDKTITLKPFTDDDIDAHVSGDDEEQIKWLNDGHPSTMESTSRWVARNKKFWEENGPIFNFAIRDANNELVGMIDANTDTSNLIGLTAGDANISYSLHPSARGKGFASRAVTLVEDFLAEKGIKRSVIRVHPGNKASAAVPIRLGYEDHGVIDTDDGGLRIFSKDL